MEHLGLPAAEHVREGVIAARIAGHAADIAKGVPGAAEWDREFSKRRRARDWEGQLRTCMDPKKARANMDKHGVSFEGARSVFCCSESTCCYPVFPTGYQDGPDTTGRR
jgi:phosphomethylpyrimidine synthase